MSKTLSRSKPGGEGRSIGLTSLHPLFVNELPTNAFACARPSTYFGGSHPVSRPRVWASPPQERLGCCKEVLPVATGWKYNLLARDIPDQYAKSQQPHPVDAEPTMLQGSRGK